MIEQVEDTVTDSFDKRTWHVTETVMSSHMTLCIDGLKSCFGLIIVGQSGTGKTTALDAFEGLHGQFYRTDEVTPASFVSHDSSKTEEELRQDDLLPKIKHQTVLNPEMANWFSGDWDTRSDKWATLIRVMDGGGYTRNSGTQGERGYTGNYRFNFVGATTPLDERNWETMSHAGNRFLFHEMPQKADRDVYDDIYYSETEYGEKVQAIQDVVQDFLTDRWEQVGGPEAVDWPSTLDEEIVENLMYLSELVRHARAPEDGEPESPHRLAESLRNLARGHALLYGRGCHRTILIDRGSREINSLCAEDLAHYWRDTSNKPPYCRCVNCSMTPSYGRQEVTIEDLEVCGRVALSTMPAKRRPIVREVVQLQPGEQLPTPEVVDRLETTRPTAGKRMDLVDTLGIGATVEDTKQGGQTKVLVPEPDFIWPDELPYPYSEKVSAK